MGAVVDFAAFVMLCVVPGFFGGVVGGSSPSTEPPAICTQASKPEARDPVSAPKDGVIRLSPPLTD